ncbi:MAG: hypothetical protein WC829_01955 [Hyphomicrobium sp.]|jgi:hypothetical protein
MGSISTNRYYNDPAIGQAFNNLAGIFAPPSGGDLAGYATAAAKKEEAARLAELFNYAKDPNYSREIADRYNYAVNGNANNTFYNVDQGNLTLRANNTDNNAGAMARQRLVQDQETLRNAANNDAALIRAIAANNVGPNQTNRLPPKLAERLGMDATFTGVTSAAPGETLVLPGGEVRKGVDKPLTETEWKAGVNADLRKQGLLTDQQLADAVLGEQTPVRVVGDTGVPKFTSPGEAVRTGAQPYEAATQSKPDLGEYFLPDGRKGSAVYKADGWYDAQTNTKLPPDATVTNMRTTTGSLDEVGLGTKTNFTDANDIEAQIKYGLERVQTFRTLLETNPGILGVPGMIRGFAQDFSAGVQDMAAYGGVAPEAFKSLEEVRAIAERVANAKGYDPAIRQAQSMALEMAYLDAKAADPSGEVNVREMERYLEKYNGGWAGNQAALASLSTLESSMRDRLRLQVPTLKNPGSIQAPDTKAGTPAVEKWQRGADGKLIRAQ